MQEKTLCQALARSPNSRKPQHSSAREVLSGSELGLATGAADLNGHGVVGPPRCGRRWAGRANDGAQRAFPVWQPIYAAHGIATFPVRIIERENGKTDKVPATKGYLRTGIRGSTALARKLRTPMRSASPAASATSSWCAMSIPRTKMSWRTHCPGYGPTPLIIRTASRKWHAGTGTMASAGACRLVLLFGT